MKTLVIHIGIMKTGTSTIQKFLADNTEALKKQNYVFPHTSDGLPSIYHNRNGYFMVYHDSREKDDTNKIKAWKKGWKIVEKEMRKGNNIILSDESIWYRQFWDTWNKKPFWENVKEKADQYGYQIKVIAYIRRQDLFVESYWNTAIRGDTRSKLSFHDYVKKKKYEFCEIAYEKQIQRMSEIFDKDALIIRPFEKEQFAGKNHDLVSDFLESLDIEYTDDFQMTDEAANTAVSGNYLEIKRLFNQITAYPKYQNFLRYPVQRASSVADQYGEERNTAYFGDMERKEFLSVYEQGNEWIAKEFLKREDGILFYEAVTEKDIWVNPYEKPMQDVVRVMGEIACSQYVQIKRLQDRVTELEKNRGITSRISLLMQKLFRKINRC